MNEFRQVVVLASALFFAAFTAQAAPSEGAGTAGQAAAQNGELAGEHDCQAVRDTLVAQWEEASDTGSEADWARAAETARLLTACPVMAVQARNWTAKALNRAGRYAEAEAYASALRPEQAWSRKDSLYASYVLYAGYLAAYSQGDDVEAARLIRRSEALDPHTSPDWTGQVGTNLIGAHTSIGAFDRARSYAESTWTAIRGMETDGDSLSRYRRARLLNAEARVDVWEAYDTWSRHHCNAAYLSARRAQALRTKLDRAAQLYRAAGHPDRLASLYTTQASLALLRMQYGQARSWSDRAIALSDSLNYVWSRSSARFVRARIQLATGQSEAALRTVQRASALLDTTSSDDASLVRRRYAPGIDRLKAQIYYAEGRYAPLLATLWTLRTREGPGGGRHFAVAEASTVPFAETVGGLAGLLISLVAGVGFVARRFRRRGDGPPNGPPNSLSSGGSDGESPSEGEATAPGDRSPPRSSAARGRPARRVPPLPASHPGPVHSARDLICDLRLLVRRPSRTAARFDRTVHELSNVRTSGPEADQTAGAWSLHQHDVDWEAVDEACHQMAQSAWETPTIAGSGLQIVFISVQDSDRARTSTDVVCPITHRSHDAEQRGAGTAGRGVRARDDLSFPYVRWTQYDDGGEGEVAGHVYVPIDPATLQRGTDAVLTAFLNYLEERAREAALQGDMVASAISAVRSLSQLQSPRDGNGAD